MKLRWMIVSLATVALLALVLVSASSDDTGSAQWIDVKSGAFVRRVPGGGELHSSNSIAVGCPAISRMWNFTITSLADEGIEVEAGTPVMSFDAQQLVERLQVAQSELKTARSELEKTKLEQDEQLEQMSLEQVEIEARMSRMKRKLAAPEGIQARLELEKLRLDDELAHEEMRLVDLRLAAQKENRVASVANAENQVSTLEHKVEVLEQSITRLTTVAQKSGFVVHVPDWNGNKPKVGESIWAGRSILEIADLSKMEVAAEIDEREARYVREGQAVEIRLDASPDRVFLGRVEELGRLFHEKSVEVPRMVFEAVISIDEPDAALMRPGMAVKVELLAPTADSVIQIPEHAVVQGSEEPLVEVERDGARFSVVVDLGERWEGWVIVKAGLEVGDRIRVRRDAA